MLRIERKHEDVLTVVTDDTNGELVELEDALDECAPSLNSDFAQVSPDADGIARFDVREEDWSGLLDAIDMMTDIPDAPDAAEAVSAAIKEREVA